MGEQHRGVIKTYLTKPALGAATTVARRQRTVPGFVLPRHRSS
ncbi:hypothetical protein ABT346_30710 [Micromonospora peucetia]